MKQVKGEIARVTGAAMVGVPSVPVKMLTPLLKVLLPVAVMDRINALMGMWHVNDSWKGRGQPSV